MALWDSLFSYLRQPIAQILLTRNDIADVSPPRPVPLPPVLAASHMHRPTGVLTVATRGRCT